MGWGDDFLAGIEEKAQSVVSGVSQSASDFIQTSVSSALVRVGPKPTGNLSAQELANGERGGQPGLQPSSQDSGLLTRASGSIGVPSSMMIPIAIGAALILFIALKRGR